MFSFFLFFAKFALNPSAPILSPKDGQVSPRKIMQVSNFTAALDRTGTSLSQATRTVVHTMAAEGGSYPGLSCQIQVSIVHVKYLGIA